MIKRTFEPEFKGSRFNRFGGFNIATAAALVAGIAMLGSTARPEAPTTALTSSGVAKTALKNSVINSPSASKAEYSSSTISERYQKAIKQATVRVIIGNQEGTGVLVKYHGKNVVMTAAHIASDITHRPFGLIPKSSGVFEDNKAVDYGLVNKAGGIERYVAGPSSEDDYIGKIQNMMVGPKEATGDVMMLTLDPSTTELGNRRPLPAAKFLNGIPRKGSEFYLYGNSILTDQPHEAYAKTLGVAILHSLSTQENPKSPVKTYPNAKQPYLVLGGKWASDSEVGCVRRTSGMSPINGRGGLLFGQSLLSAPGTAEWRDAMRQVAPRTSTEYSHICLVAVPQMKTHSAQSVLKFLYSGRGIAPRVS